MTISKDAADTSLLSQVLSMLFGSSSQSPSSDQGIPTTISDQGIPTTISDQGIPTTISYQGIPTSISDQGIPTTINDQGIETTMEVGANFFNHACPSVHHLVIPVMRINQS